MPSNRTPPDTPPHARVTPNSPSPGYTALKAVLGPPLRACARLRTEGLEHVPATGPAILAANHLSVLDSLYIPLVVDRRVTYMAKAEYWESWRTRWFVQAAGHIPIRRGRVASAREALGAAAGVLRSGGLLGLHPEGTRSDDGHVHRGKVGVAMLASMCDCPVVPIGITGTAEILPKGTVVPRRRVDVVLRFGAPMTIAPDDGRRAFMDALMTEIATLSGQRYVGSTRERGTAPRSLVAS